VVVVPSQKLSGTSAKVSIIKPTIAKRTALSALLPKTAFFSLHRFAAQALTNSICSTPSTDISALKEKALPLVSSKSPGSVMNHGKVKCPPFLVLLKALLEGKRGSK
jgi:hypothetical protein